MAAGTSTTDNISTKIDACRGIPNLLAYARFHGLALDHLRAENNPIRHFHEFCNQGREEDPAKNFSNEDIDWDTLKSSDKDALANALKEDKLQLSKSAANLLADAVTPPHWVPEWKDLWHRDNESNHRRPQLRKIATRMKFETPLLLTDHQKDLVMFKRRPTVEELLMLCKQDKEKTNECDEERERWFSDVAGASAHFRNAIQNEKARVTRDALIRMMEIVANQDYNHEQTLQKVWNTELGEWQKKKSEPWTPVLTPMSEEDLAGEQGDALEINRGRKWHPPGLPDLEPQLTSEVVDLESPLGQQIVKDMEKEETSNIDNLPEDEQEKIHRSLHQAENGSGWSLEEIRLSQNQESPHRKRELLEEKDSVQQLELENPLTLLDSDKKRLMEEDRMKRANEALHYLLPELDEIRASDAQQINTARSDFEPSGQSTEDELLRLCDKASSNTEAMLNEQRIEEPGQMAHIEVPRVEPRNQNYWTHVQAQRDKFLKDMLELPGMECISIDHNEERNMNWVPFPIDKCHIDLSETIEDRDQYLSKVLEPPSQIVRSEQLLWRADKLSLLTEDSDESEIEEDKSLAQECDDVATVPRKRHSEQTETSPEPSHVMANVGLSMDDQKGASCVLPPNESLRPAPWLSNKDESASQKSIRERVICGASLFSETESQGSTYSTSRNLSSFLETRGRKFKKPKWMKGNSVVEGDKFDPIEATQDPVIGASCERVESAGDVEVPTTPILAYTQPGAESSPNGRFPGVQPLTKPRTIMINNELIRTQRDLISFFESHAKNDESGDEEKEKLLNIIYHDFHGHRSSVTQSDGQKSVPDIVLNPTMCIVITTMQALTQRLLPGQRRRSQSGMSMVHDRLLGLLEDYEKTFVLVCYSHPQISDPIALNSLSNSDGTLWMTFTAFCGSLAEIGSIVPILVPILNHESPGRLGCVRSGTAGRTSDSKCAWVWELTTRYSFENLDPQLGPISLIHDDTVWSLFLQRCGLNEFAAQVVLSAMSRDRVPDATAGDWGLRRFMQMDALKRAEMFGGLLGSKAMSQVSETLDRSWTLPP